jgi:hypothetical protein
LGIDIPDPDLEDAPVEEEEEVGVNLSGVPGRRGKTKRTMSEGEKKDREMRTRKEKVCIHLCIYEYMYIISPFTWSYGHSLLLYNFNSITFHHLCQ